MFDVHIYSSISLRKRGHLKKVQYILLYTMNNNGTLRQRNGHLELCTRSGRSVETAALVVVIVILCACTAIVLLMMQEEIDPIPPNNGLSMCTLVRIESQSDSAPMHLLWSLKAQSILIHTQIFLIDRYSLLYDDYSTQNEIESMLTDSFIVRRPDLKTILDANVVAPNVSGADSRVTNKTHDYFPIDLALKSLLDDSEKYGCDYVLITGYDFVYPEDFIESMIADMMNGTERIVWERLIGEAEGEAVVTSVQGLKRCPPQFEDQPHGRFFETLLGGCCCKSESLIEYSTT